ncbi:MAG: hypothetical protein KAR42_17640 [candidate division Zixibacteria bacterium]|nr:hypothetical protein [candidate division Zixibacteria bacterium]
MIRIIIFLLFILASSVMGQVKQIEIKHPGIGGVNTYFGESYLQSNEARELINFDIIDGDLVKRAGYGVVYIGSDTICDGIMAYYDIDDSARLFKVSYDNDTGIIYSSNPNSFGITTDSILPFRQYVNPVWGTDWVQLDNALFAVNGKSQPVFYHEDEMGTLSIPTPGAPMVEVLNKSGGPTGTYSYKLHYLADTSVNDAAANLVDTAQKSYPGQPSAYIYANDNPVVLSALPEKPHAAAGGSPSYDSAHVLITRNKNGTSIYYVLDTLSYFNSDGLIYIDTFTDASLGDSILISDSTSANCCEDSVLTPGEAFIHRIPSPSWVDDVLGDASVDTFFMAYSYLDTNLRIESEIGYWSYITAQTINWSLALAAAVPLIGSNFIDGIIVYCTYEAGVANNDSLGFRAFDTIFVSDTLVQWREYGGDQWWNWGDDYDSAHYFARTYQPYPLTNKIPYKYIAHSYSRLWAAGDEDFPSRLYYSGRTDTFALGYWNNVYDYLAINEDDGSKIMGLISVENGVVVFKGKSMWFVSGTDPEYDMRLQKISLTVGLATNNSIVNYAGVVYFLSPDGKVYAWNGQSPQEISRKIWDSFKDLSSSVLAGATATVFDDEYWLQVNDTLFICEMASGAYRWRKSSLDAEYFASFDTTGSGEYAQVVNTIFSREGTDSLFWYDYGDTCTRDGTDSIPVVYKSAPLLTNTWAQIYGGRIRVDIPVDDTILVRILSINDDTLSSVIIVNDETYSDDMYDFAVETPVGVGFYLVILDDGSCSALRIKQIVLDYQEYGGLGL